MYSAAAVADAYGGIATRSQILAAGLSGSDITAAVRRGELWRVRRAHYATSSARPDAVAAVRIGGRLCGVSAARTYGIWAGDDTRIHVAVAPNASRLRLVREGGVVTADIGDRPAVVHWTAAESTRECWRVSLADCLRLVVESSDREMALACLDTAMEVHGLTATHLAALFASSTAEARLRAASAEPGCGSGYESFVGRRLRAAGHSVRRQVWIPGVGRVDAVVDDILLLEIDGYEFHVGRDAFEEDRRRDSGSTAGGRPTIRLGTRRIDTDWEGCLTDIRSAISEFRSRRGGSDGSGQ